MTTRRGFLKMFAGLAACICLTPRKKPYAGTTTTKSTGTPWPPISDETIAASQHESFENGIYPHILWNHREDQLLLHRWSTTAGEFVPMPKGSWRWKSEDEAKRFSMKASAIASSRGT